MDKVITDIQKLKTPCEPCATVEEGEEIARLLFLRMSEGKDTIEMAAQMLGFNKAVCCVNVTEPVYFVNPKITESSGNFMWREKCLSFPGKEPKTVRHTSVTVTADNFKEPRTFAFDETSTLDIALECIAVQHAIDHLSGILISDRSTKPVKIALPFGRNEKVTISKGTETKEVKAKKLEQYVNEGWEILTPIQGE